MLVVGLRRGELLGLRWDDVDLGVRQLRMAAYRRTCPSLLVELDVHPSVAMQILRHSRIAITMKPRALAKRLGD
jgi:hypothetical protein